MKKNKTKISVFVFFLVIATIFAVYYFGNKNQKLTLNGQEIPDTTLDELEELEENRPPLEVYVLDQETIPKDRGISGMTYTADIYIVDNVEKQVHGPYKGSSYPNSRETPKGSDRPNTANSEMHLFNNRYGHKASQIKGLNLIDAEKNRYTDGYSWSAKPKLMKYVNVHSGISDRGNYNSRGSLGCITIHPDEVKQFWKHFDFSTPRKNFETPKVFTTGTSEGVVFISRTNEAERKKLINEIKEVYE